VGRLWVTVGPPASGKSLWAVGSGKPVVSLDEGRSGSDPHKVFLSARRRVRKLLADGDVVVDACSLQAATRAGWLNLADGQATAVLFDVPAAECVRRNSERGSSAVPDAQMERLCALTPGAFAAVFREPWSDVVVRGWEPVVSREW